MSFPAHRAVASCSRSSDTRRTASTRVDQRASRALRAPTPSPCGRRLAFSPPAVETIQDLNATREADAGDRAQRAPPRAPGRKTGRQADTRSRRPLDLETSTSPTGDIDLSKLVQEAIDRLREEVERTGARWALSAPSARPGALAQSPRTAVTFAGPGGAGSSSAPTPGSSTSGGSSCATSTSSKMGLRTPRP